MWTASRTSLHERLSEDYRENNLPPLLPDWQRELTLPDRLGLRKDLPVIRERIATLSNCHCSRGCCSPALSMPISPIPTIFTGVWKATEPVRKMPVRGPRWRSCESGSTRVWPTSPARAESIRCARRSYARSEPRPACALDHALAHGWRRVIYVPFTSIVEQAVQVFRQALGVQDRDDVVLEHHSTFFDDPTKELQAIDRRKLAMENWNAPIAVTTTVQLFESVFADRPSRCRKLHIAATWSSWAIKKLVVSFREDFILKMRQ